MLGINMHIRNNYSLTRFLFLLFMLLSASGYADTSCLGDCRTDTTNICRSDATPTLFTTTRGCDTSTGCASTTSSAVCTAASPSCEAGPSYVTYSPACNSSGTDCLQSGAVDTRTVCRTPFPSCSRGDITTSTPTCDPRRGCVSTPSTAACLTAENNCSPDGRFHTTYAPTCHSSASCDSTGAPTTTQCRTPIGRCTQDRSAFTTYSPTCDSREGCSYVSKTTQCSGGSICDSNDGRPECVLDESQQTSSDPNTGNTQGVNDGGILQNNSGGNNLSPRLRAESPAFVRGGNKKLKPIIIVPGKPRTIKVNPSQYAGIDFNSARLVNPENNLAIKGFRIQAKNGDSRQCAPNPRCLMLTLIPPQKMPNGMFKLRMQGANNKRIILSVEIKGSVKQVTHRKQPIVNTKRPVQRPSNLPNKGVYSGSSGSGYRPTAAVVSKGRPTVKSVDTRNSAKAAATDSRKVGVKPVLKPKAEPSGLKGEGVNPAVIGGSRDPRGDFDSRGSRINPR